MNRFVNSVRNVSAPMALTENGAATFATTTDACVDFFFKVGALRGQPDRALAAFVDAYHVDPELACRIALWARDIRGGAGERAAYRAILGWLNDNDSARAARMAKVTPRVGRWDDILTISNEYVLSSMLRAGLTDPNTRGLVAKWLPREKSAKASQARRVMRILGLSPKVYRKLLADTSNTVEQLMCSRRWTEINLEHVPSLAQSRYRNAFQKHLGITYQKYVKAAEEGKVSINAGAVYPYDVLKTLDMPKCYDSYYHRASNSDTAKSLARAQWAALPNYLGSAGTVLPMLDTSGSMSHSSGVAGLSVGQIAMSLALYLAHKQESPFKNLVLTFSSEPKFVELSGDVVTDVDKFPSIVNNTNIAAAFDLILSTAKKDSVPASDMPKFLLVLSDMEFDSCVDGRTNFASAKQKFERAGYQLPTVVFWNLQSRGDKNFPVTAHTSGAALVSGFSPAIAKAVLSMDPEGVSPRSAMLRAVSAERYDY